MAKNFEGSVVMISGAAGGIGRAAALAFADKGARLAVCDLDTENLNETADLVRQKGCEVVALPGDFSDSRIVAASVSKTVQSFGGLDCAFNNAGILHPSDVNWEEEAFRRTIEVNLYSVMYCMKYQIPEMLRRGKGAIVNTASVVGLVGGPNSPAYVASKHAVIGLTKSAALKYVRSNIRVNALCPGITRTKIIDELLAKGGSVSDGLMNYSPMGRIGEPNEMADAVLWLCSDESSYVTGHALVVDGGFVSG